MGREARRGQAGRARAADPLRRAEAVRAIAPAWHAPLRRIGWVALAAVKGATLIYTVEAILRPHQRKYHGKAMRIRSLGYLGGLALVPGVWLAGGRQGRYPVAADLSMSSPLLVDAAGNSLGIYDEARIDDLVHGLNAAVLSSLFGAVVSPHLPSREAATAATLAFGLTGELAFDAMEYAAERIGFHGLGLSDRDTLADMALAAVGTSVAAAVTWFRWRPPAAAPLVDGAFGPPTRIDR